MKKTLKRFFIIAGCVVGVILTGLGAMIIFGQKVIEPFEVNSPDLPTGILIASQGSDFKEALTTKVIDFYRDKSIYLKIIDATTLTAEKEEAWDAVVIITTAQAGRLPEAVSKYLEKMQQPEKTVMLITSGGGTWQLKGSPVDAITTASSIDRIDTLAEEIIRQLTF